jgi:hypothetical protein
VGSKSFLKKIKTQLDTSPNKAQQKQELLCGSKSFLKKKIKTQLDTSPNKAQHKQELLCGKIFGSGRNVYVVDEPFYFYSTPINLKIKVQQD